MSFFYISFFLLHYYLLICWICNKSPALHQKHNINMLMSRPGHRFLLYMEAHVTSIIEKSTHLNKRMPVGHRFTGICEHFTPVFSTKAVCITANSTHTNDFIMAHPIGAGGKERISLNIACILKNNSGLKKNTTN